MLLQVRKRIDSMECRIQGRLDRGTLRGGGFPQVDFVRSFEVGAVGSAQHFHPRTIRIRRVRFHHHRDLAGSQTDEVAGGINADKLRESPHQVLIELCSVVALEHREEIFVLKVNRATHGIDTPEQYQAFVRRYREQAKS